MKFTLLFPIIPWLLQLIVFAWFVAVGVYPFSIAEKELFSNLFVTTGCSFEPNYLQPLGLGVHFLFY